MGFTKIYRHIIVCTLIFLIIYLPVISAEEYYADVRIDVDSYGFVTIDGTTNYPDFLVENTEMYTLKKQSNWLLNITKDENFTDFAYVLTLPEGSSVNYIKSSGFIRIREDLGKLVINGFGENEIFSIQVQYQIGKIIEESFMFDPIFIFLIFIIIVLIVILVGFFIKERVKIQSHNEDSYNFKGLKQRQKEIMELLIDRKTPLTQTEIQKELKIPKSAISRNIRSLELKGLIEKEQIGMSNLIKLKKN